MLYKSCTNSNKIVKRNQKQKLVWSVAADSAFLDMITLIGTATSLHFHNPLYPIFIEMDACKLGVAGICYQTILGSIYPLQFISKSFDAVQSRWPTIEQESFGIYYGVTKCKSIILGYHFYMHTDHANITYILKHESAKITR